MNQITSKSNDNIKRIRQLKQKKYRDETENFYLEGLRLIGEAIKAENSLECIYYCPELVTSDFGWKAISSAQQKGIEIIEVSEEVFRSFSLKDGPQGLAGIGKQKWVDLEDMTSINGLWIALDSIQDPGNLGSIMRSLDGAEGKGLILLGNSTDSFHPTAVRSSTGAIFSLDICKTSVRKLIDFKNDSNIPLIGAVCDNVISYKIFDYPEDLILIMGSEQKGLQKDVTDICDELITIPMGGSVDSLNLSCAASIIMLEIYNKRLKS